MKHGMDEVLLVPYKCCVFLARSANGADLGQGQNRSKRSPFFKELLLQTGRLHDVRPFGPLVCHLDYFTNIAVMLSD